MIHSFLMIGQSNMAGRGYLKEVPLIFDEKIKMLRNGRWQILSEPVNYDRPVAGASLAVSFAAAWRMDHGQEEAGLIPCAEGGASLDDWTVGSALFTHAILQARLAQRSSKLTALLWHQGESDCFPDRAAVYSEKLGVIVDALRRELDAPDMPLIVGGLGDYLTSGIYGQYFSAYAQVNEALRHFALTQPHCYYVSATGLSSNPDGVHLNAVSLRRFGIRYYRAFDKRRHIEVPEEEDSLLATIYNRPFNQGELIALLELQFAGGSLTPEEYTRQLEDLRKQG
ncbi:sialate O-acetylesterase [Taibaiella koreensis]|uniref:sialate O-acetylesterase n=1 Tax=Taibaiella koreensis TaxID=1268548 RepID=UPI000E59AE51|nr:sialate O-acetylesterase [Taibaiella koreensis]